MCDICKKVDFTIETMEMLLDHRTLMEHISEIGLNRQFGPKYEALPDKEKSDGARMSLLLLAVSEMALKYGLDRETLHKGVEYGIRRAALKQWLRDHGQLGEEHD
jgi:hypothetical protein